jgi:ankyrin repeat protein
MNPDVQANGVNELRVASADGDFEVVTRLLNQGVNINSNPQRSHTALHSASYRGQLEIARLLLDRGANINAYASYWGSPLVAACLGGHLEMARLLLDRGADINAQGGSFGNALHAASSKGHELVAEFLLNRGAEINAPAGPHCSPLIAAVSERHIETIKMLLSRGAEVDAKGFGQANALHAASALGDVEIVRLLIDSGARLSIRDEYPDSPLREASQRGNLEVVQLLLDRGAPVTTLDQNCDPALFIASANGHLEVVRLLLERGASIGIRKGGLLAWKGSLRAWQGQYTSALDVSLAAEHLEISKLLTRASKSRFSQKRVTDRSEKPIKKQSSINVLDLPAEIFFIILRTLGPNYINDSRALLICKKWREFILVLRVENLKLHYPQYRTLPRSLESFVFSHCLRLEIILHFFVPEDSSKIGVSEEFEKQGFEKQRLLQWQRYVPQISSLLIHFEKVKKIRLVIKDSDIHSQKQSGAPIGLGISTMISTLPKTVTDLHLENSLPLKSELSGQSVHICSVISQQLLFLRNLRLENFEICPDFMLLTSGSSSPIRSIGLRLYVHRMEDGGFYASEKNIQCGATSIDHQEDASVIESFLKSFKRVSPQMPVLQSFVMICIPRVRRDYIVKFDLLAEKRQIFDHWDLRTSKIRDGTMWQ